MLALALTIWTGAYLLFQVQPLIGKCILRWSGGSPGVWTTCMLFFQLSLLGGYAYAHTVRRRLRLRMQAALHFVLLAAALATWPVTPSGTFSWRTPGSSSASPENPARVRKWIHAFAGGARQAGKRHDPKTCRVIAIPVDGRRNPCFSNLA